MSENSSAGKTPRDRRRLSSDPPYKKARTAMPATRRSPARPPQDTSEPEEPLPLASIMQELALLRRAMESRFSEAEKKSDSLRGELVGKLDANDKAVSDLQVAVTDVTLGVDENQRAIHQVRAEVERREVELPGKVRAIVQEVLDKCRPRQPPTGRQTATGPRHRPLGDDYLPPGGTPNPPDRSEEAYDVARRSLRLWPVSREGDLATRTREFLVSELLVDQDYVLGLNFTVKRAAGLNRNRDRDGASTSQRVKDEVLVLFETRRERDDVRGHAKNLEKKGRGVRLEVPDQLWPSFRALQNLAYELKQKTPSLRRNILFDDVSRDLKLDFSTGQEEWKSVSPQEARKALQNFRPARTGRVAVSASELGDMLGGKGSADEEMDEEY